MRARSWLVGMVALVVVYVLYLVSQLGSIGIALGLAAFFALFGLFLFATRKRPGRRYDKRAPSRADADLQTWGTSP